MAFTRLAIATIAIAAWTINLSGQNDKSPALTKNKENDARSQRVVFPYIDIGQQEPTPKTTSANAEPPHWYESAEWWLFIIAIPTLIVFGWQAFETRRAVEATRDTVKHMAIQSGLLGPRLHIKGVRVTNFEVGQQPWFFIEIANSGPRTAENVVLSMRIESGLSTGIVGAKWSREQVVTIPENSSREYFINWVGRLTNDAYAGFQMVVPLCVSGYYKIGQTTVEYCYKYNPFPISPRDRPQGLPEFIPCDFDPGLAILVSAIGDASGKSTAHAVGTFIATDAGNHPPDLPEPPAN